VIPFLPDLPTYTVKASGASPALAVVAALLQALLAQTTP
jgi:hypothetical protein